MAWARTLDYFTSKATIMKTNTGGITFVLLALASGGALLQACSSGGSTSSATSSGAQGGTGGASSASSGSGGDGGTSSASTGHGGGEATSSSGGTGGTGATSSASGGTGGQGAPDGGTDAGDGGTVVGTCATEICRMDQACVAGHCTTACVGSQVPGDYATVQAAVSAVQAVGGTICLGPQTFNEEVTIANANPLTLIGTSSLSGINGYVIINNTASSVTLRNFTVTTATTVIGAVKVFDNAGSLSVKLLGMRVGNAADFGSGFLLDQTTGVVNILLDGCDITGPTGAAAIYLSGNHGQGINDSLTMVVQNSYLHDASFGLYSDAILMSLALENNTIVNNATGIDAHVGFEELTLTSFNSIITGSSVGISLSGSAGNVTSGQNLLFGNTTNYMGLAVDGPGYVKADPLFDTTTAPPGVEVGSPARGAADPTKGPATDFYGHARPATPDMGAVQMWNGLRPARPADARRPCGPADRRAEEIHRAFDRSRYADPPHDRGLRDRC